MFRPEGHYEAKLLLRYKKEGQFVYFCNGFVVPAETCSELLYKQRCFYSKNSCICPDCLLITRLRITQRDVMTKDLYMIASCNLHVPTFSVLQENFFRETGVVHRITISFSYFIFFSYWFIYSFTLDIKCVLLSS